MATFETDMDFIETEHFVINAKFQQEIVKN